jgi:hypothetical protein
MVNLTQCLYDCTYSTPKPRPGSWMYCFYFFPLLRTGHVSTSEVVSIERNWSGGFKSFGFFTFLEWQGAGAYSTFIPWSMIPTPLPSFEGKHKDSTPSYRGLAKWEHLFHLHSIISFTSSCRVYEIPQGVFHGVSVVDPDPHRFWNLYPDPHKIKIRNRIRIFLKW